jgi:hypothetical protein
MPAFRRIVSWTREDQLWEHLNVHVKACAWPRQCPHPVCAISLSNTDAFRFHLIADHSISSSRAKDNTMSTIDTAVTIKSPNLKRKSSKIEWISSEESETTCRPSKAVKRTQLKTAAINPRLLTSENTDSRHRDGSPGPEESPIPAPVDLNDQLQELECISPSGVWNQDPPNDDFFNEFIRSPSPLTDYSGDTAVPSSYGHLSRTSTSDDSDVSKAVQKMPIACQIRLRLRPKINLLLRRPGGVIRIEMLQLHTRQVKV